MGWKRRLAVYVGIGASLILLWLAAACGAPSSTRVEQTVASATPSQTAAPSATKDTAPSEWTATPIGSDQVGDKAPGADSTKRAPASPAVEGTAAPGLTVVATRTAQAVEIITVPISPTIPTPTDGGLQNLVQQAKEDLVLRLGVDPGQIELVEFTDILWPDKGLGCPFPGMNYPQVPVDGVLIRLRVGKRIYPYHRGGSGPPFLCEQEIEIEKRP